MTEKWIVDDAGTLINMSTRNHYDYMEEVVDVLNNLSEENEQLKKENKALKMELKRLYGEEEDDDDYDLWVMKQVKRSRDLE